MSNKSDLVIDAVKFDPRSISQQTKDFNASLHEIMDGIPKWWEVGAEQWRRMRDDGETPLPKPVILDSGKDVLVPSHEKNRSISCRIFFPASAKPRGVYLHIHGGGWVLFHEKSQDPMLRLAPEYPFPAANDDCMDVAEFLIDNAQREYSVPLLFMGGESAGGHLCMVTMLHLRDKRPDFSFSGLILNYGVYDLAGFSPSVHYFDNPLIVDHETMQHFIPYLPSKTEAERRDPRISPLFADLSKVKCPPALFTVGTLDPLMDDTVMMATKWMRAGHEAILKIYPGAPHTFVIFPPPAQTETVRQALENITAFLQER